MLKAGVAERVITPNFPTLMAGYPEPKDRYCTDIHDDLRAHVLYLKKDEEEYAIVTLDLVNYSKKRVNLVRKRIEDTVGIASTHICISCTHTHSGPCTQTVPFWIRDDRKEMYPHYLDYVDQKITEAVREAKAYSFDAQLGTAKGYCGKEQGVGGNRRHKDGPCDPEVAVIAVREAHTKKLRGVFVNYALHPTFLHAENTSMTADYPAYIYEFFKRKDAALTVGFMIGAAGNQSSRNFRIGQSFEEAKRVGYALGEAAQLALDQMIWNDDPELMVQSSFVTPPMRQIPTLEKALADQKDAEQRLRDAKAAGMPYAFCRTIECTLFGANHMLRISRAGTPALEAYARNAPFEIFLLRLGDACLITAPGEYFVEFGLQIKAGSPYPNTIFATCSNGSAAGYLCTAEAHSEGGYEALGSVYPPEAGEAIVDAAVKLLCNMKEIEDDTKN